jgi:hypothetical protein
MKAFVSTLAVALMHCAQVTASRADEQPNGIYVQGCPDYTLVNDLVQQLCNIDSIPQRDVLTVEEFFRAFRDAGGNSTGGSDEAASDSE